MCSSTRGSIGGFCYEDGVDMDVRSGILLVTAARGSSGISYLVRLDIKEKAGKGFDSRPLVPVIIAPKYSGSSLGNRNIHTPRDRRTAPQIQKRTTQYMKFSRIKAA